MSDEQVEQHAGQTDNDSDLREASQAARRIRIGSQRYGVRSLGAKQDEPAAAPTPAPPTITPPTIAEPAVASAAEPPATVVVSPAIPSAPPTAAPAGPRERPQIARRLSPEVEAELAEALGETSIDDLVGGNLPAAATADVEMDTRRQGRVLSIHGDDVFVDIGARNQAVVSLRQFIEPPSAGALVEVIVGRFNPDEGLYTALSPGGAVKVEDWSQLQEGLVVEARITGHNKGGLECVVGGIRGFIPAGQISLYRVEDFAQFENQTLNCVVTEANADRRNLVLSHRAYLERQKAESRDKLLAELAAGQIREGVVRSIRDFGAFVDLGGVDGLIHVSQLGWQRVKHPSEVLSEGQRVSVKVVKIDPDTHKIGLSLRDLTESPWTGAAGKYPVTSRHTGTVSKLMDFGAFVQLEPGIEGLAHISELAHHRVFRVGDVVSEGQEVDVKVLSVDEENQRISLSIKACLNKPEPQKKDSDEEPVLEEAVVAPVAKKSPATLKGGRTKPSVGEQFGLRW